MKIWVLFLCMTVFFVQSGFAQDIITLKNGRRVEGTVIRQTDEVIMFRVGGVTHTYGVNKIASIEQGGAVTVIKDEKPKSEPVKTTVGGPVVELLEQHPVAEEVAAEEPAAEVLTEEISVPEAIVEDVPEEDDLKGNELIQDEPIEEMAAQEPLEEDIIEESLIEESDAVDQDGIAEAPVDDEKTEEELDEEPGERLDEELDAETLSDVAEPEL